MTSVFATAGQTTDRRRRLMAHEGAIQDTELLREFGISVDAATPTDTPVDRIGERLIGRLISRRLWKHVSIVVLLLCMTGGIAAWTATAEPGAGLTQQLHTTAQESMPGVAALLLLLAGQLAVLTGWLRSHSSVDFHGRYRAWYWLGWYLFMLTALLVMRAPNMLMALLAAVVQPAAGNLNAARPALLLVPMLAFGAVICWRLIPDLGRNRVSQTLFILALIASILFIASLSTRFTGWLPTGLLHAMPLVAASLLFSACLLHCRFVAHINNDPPIPTAYSKSTSSTTYPCAANVQSKTMVAETEPRTLIHGISTAVPKCEALGQDHSALPADLHLTASEDAGREEPPEVKVPSGNASSSGKPRKASRQRKAG